MKVYEMIPSSVYATRHFCCKMIWEETVNYLFYPIIKNDRGYFVIPSLVYMFNVPYNPYNTFNHINVAIYTLETSELDNKHQLRIAGNNVAKYEYETNRFIVLDMNRGRLVYQRFSNQFQEAVEFKKKAVVSKAINNV